jgi:hypothetical protein
MAAMGHQVQRQDSDKKDFGLLGATRGIRKGFEWKMAFNAGR